MGTVTRDDHAACSLLICLAAAFLISDQPTVAYGYYDGQVAGGAANDEDSSTTWSDWARDKMTQGLGHRHENAKKAAQQMMDVAGDIAKSTKAKMSDHMTYGGRGVDVTTEKAGEAKDAVMDKAGEAKDCMMNAAGNAKETVMNQAGGMASGAYRAADVAPQKAREAKDYVTDKADEAIDAMMDKGGYAAADTAGRAYEGAVRNAERA